MRGKVDVTDLKLCHEALIFKIELELKGVYPDFLGKGGIVWAHRLKQVKNNIKLAVTKRVNKTPVQSTDNFPNDPSLRRK